MARRGAALALARLLPCWQVWRYLIQISEGLEALHAQRIIHRDIKPSNIFLTAQGQVKIGDFGLGRILNDNSKARTGACMRACMRMHACIRMHACVRACVGRLFFFFCFYRERDRKTGI